MAVTFDTNVLLSATLWDASVAQKLLYDLIRKSIKIYSSLEIINEYQRILKRDFDFSNEDIDKITGKILEFVVLVNPKEKLNLVEEDPEDNAIIECALESKSEYLITYDKHLLKIEKYKEIKIIKPEEARSIF